MLETSRVWQVGVKRFGLKRVGFEVELGPVVSGGVYVRRSGSVRFGFRFASFRSFFRAVSLNNLLYCTIESVETLFLRWKIDCVCVLFYGTAFLDIVLSN